jgi:hypothetical protein
MLSSCLSTLVLLVKKVKVCVLEQKTFTALTQKLLKQIRKQQQTLSTGCIQAKLERTM